MRQFDNIERSVKELKTVFDGVNQDSLKSISFMHELQEFIKKLDREHNAFLEISFKHGQFFMSVSSQFGPMSMGNKTDTLYDAFESIVKEYER